MGDCISFVLAYFQPRLSGWITTFLEHRSFALYFVVLATTRHALFNQALLSSASVLKPQASAVQSGQPAHSKPILNKFCLYCYLNQSTIPTIDPRSTFPVYPNVLERPSLVDGSESPSSDEAQGAAADVSTASSQFGPGETVSDASQAVTDEGLARFTDFLCPGVGDVNLRHSPCTDASSTIDSIEYFNNTSPSSSGMTTETSYPPPPVLAHVNSPSSIVASRSSPSLLFAAQASPTGDRPLTCPFCPRPFTTWRDLERHIRLYRHSHRCPEPGCRWIFQAPKDLTRHFLTHMSDRPKYFCPHVDCEYSATTSEKWFSRGDLRDRHVRNFHGDTPHD